MASNTYPTVRPPVTVLDADEANSTKLVSELRRCGWPVRVVADMVALKSRIDITPGLVVMDVCADGVPRWDVLTDVRRTLPRARILILTAYPSVCLAVTAIRLGADDVLAQPFETAELVRAMEGLHPTDFAPVEPPSLARTEWEYLNRILGRTKGNISAAARLLNIQRSTLQRKLKKYPPQR